MCDDFEIRSGFPKMILGYILIEFFKLYDEIN